MRSQSGEAASRILLRADICIRRCKESGEGLLKVRFNGEKQKSLSDLLAPGEKKKVNQQAAVARNWMKPPGLPLKSMTSIFILFEHHLTLRATLF